MQCLTQDIIVVESIGSTLPPRVCRAKVATCEVFPPLVDHVLTLRIVAERREQPEEITLVGSDQRRILLHRADVKPRNVVSQGERQPVGPFPLAQHSGHHQPHARTARPRLPAVCGNDRDNRPAADAWWPWWLVAGDRRPSGFPGRAAGRHRGRPPARDICLSAPSAWPKRSSLGGSCPIGRRA